MQSCLIEHSKIARQDTLQRSLYNHDQADSVYDAVISYLVYEIAVSDF